MAPPPPASLPLTQRLLHLGQTLQFTWFVGHVTLLFCTLRYGLSYITLNYYSNWAKFTYRTAFIAAAATYGIVVYKAYFARIRAGRVKPLEVAGDENFQYLVMALIWLVSRQVPLALLPFTVYSVFHVATYTRNTLIPTITPPPPPPPGTSPKARPGPNKNSAIGESIGKFVKGYYDSSMKLVAYLEIGLWFRILLSAITFTKGAWILFGIYTIFFRARFSQSSFVQDSIHEGGSIVDATVANQSVPPIVRQGWQTVKGLIAQAADATDISRYIKEPQVAKKAQ